MNIFSFLGSGKQKCFFSLVTGQFSRYLVTQRIFVIVKFLSIVDKNSAAQLAFQAAFKVLSSALALASYLQNPAKERAAKVVVYW